MATHEEGRPGDILHSHDEDMYVAILTKYLHVAGVGTPSQHHDEASQTDSDDEWEIVDREAAIIVQDDAFVDNRDRLHSQDSPRQPGTGAYLEVMTERQSYSNITTPALISTCCIDQQDQAPFFTLPVEIRLDIYELVLRLPDSVHIDWQPPTKGRAHSVLALLEICRRVHDEAEDIFYAINHLSCSVPGTPSPYPINISWAIPFLAVLGPRRRAAMASLTIYTTSAPLAAIEELHLMPNLRQVNIELAYCIRSTSVYPWTILATQMKMGLQRLKHLKEVNLLLPEATDGLRAGEVDPSLVDFRKVIARLREAVAHDR